MSAQAPIVFDPREVAVTPNPFALFHRLQDEDPVHWSPRLSAWILTRYEDVRRAVITADMSADRLRPFFAQLPEAERGRLGDLIRYLTPWSVFRDPPDHTRIRSMMEQGFHAARGRVAADAEYRRHHRRPARRHGAAAGARPYPRFRLCAAGDCDHGFARRAARRPRLGQAVVGRDRALHRLRAGRARQIWAARRRAPGR